MPSAFGDGVFVVNLDVWPGTYRSTGGDCYWARLSGFGGEPSDVIADSEIDFPAVVTIEPTDVGFQSQGCGSWTLVGHAGSGAPGASLSPTGTSGLHGQDLGSDELSRPGTLGMTLNQFVNRWNRETDDPELRIKKRPKVQTNDNGVRYFGRSFTPGSSNFELLGVMSDGKVSRAAIIWKPSEEGSDLGRGLDNLQALMTFYAFADTTNPDLPEDVDLLTDLGWPDSPAPGEEAPPLPFDGIEGQVTIDGVTYTLVGFLDDDGAETVWLTARQAEDALEAKPVPTAAASPS